MDMSSTPRNNRKHTPETEALAAELRAERAAQDLTQDDLARMSGIGRQTILRIENGQRAMDTAQMADLCRALGITMTAFVMRAEERVQEHARKEREQSEAARKSIRSRQA